MQEKWKVKSTNSEKTYQALGAFQYNKESLQKKQYLQIRTTQIPIKNIASVFSKTDLQFEYITSSGGRVTLSNQVWDLSDILTWP